MHACRFPPLLLLHNIHTEVSVSEETSLVALASAAVTAPVHPLRAQTHLPVWWKNAQMAKFLSVFDTDATLLNGHVEPEPGPVKLRPEKVVCMSRPKAARTTAAIINAKESPLIRSSEFYHFQQWETVRRRGKTRSAEFYHFQQAVSSSGGLCTKTTALMSGRNP